MDKVFEILNEALNHITPEILLEACQTLLQYHKVFGGNKKNTICFACG